MQFSLNFWALLYVIAATQGFFVSLLLLRIRKGKKRANRLLSALVFILSVYLFDLFLGRSNLLYQFPHLVYFAAPLWYLFAPLTFFYIKSALDEEIKINWKYFLHFVPFLVMFARQIPFFMLPADVKLTVWANQLAPSGPRFVNYIFALVAPVQILVYSYVILRVIMKKEETVSSNGKVNEAHLSWLRFTFCLLLTYAIFRIGFISHFFLFDRPIPLAVNLNFIVFALIIYSVAYFAIIEPERIFPPKLSSKSIDRNIPAKEYARRLIELVEKDKLYLQDELKYTELSQRLNISARILTEVLNKEIGASFNDFINTYRVEEVKKRLLLPENSGYSLLAIALDSGFSNKSSFNRVFKKHTGMTPSEFTAKRKAHSA